MESFRQPQKGNGGEIIRLSSGACSRSVRVVALLRRHSFFRQGVGNEVVKSASATKRHLGAIHIGLSQYRWGSHPCCCNCGRNRIAVRSAGASKLSGCSRRLVTEIPTGMADKLPGFGSKAAKP